MPSVQFLDQLQKQKTKPIVVATHPRSGTHLTIDLLRKQFRECSGWKLLLERNDRLYVNLDMLLESAPQWPNKTAIKILNRAPRAVIKTHRFPFTAFTDCNGKSEVLSEDWFSTLTQQAQIINVMRDGRDVIASYHLFRQRFDPAAHCPIGEFLRQTDHGMSRVGYWAHHVQSWDRVPGVLRVSTEEILKKTSNTLRTLGESLGMEPRWEEPLLPAPFSTLWASRRARLFGIKPESTAIIGPPQKQKWRSAFTREDRAFFHQEAGDLLIALGYEASDAWVDA